MSLTFLLLGFVGALFAMAPVSAAQGSADGVPKPPPGGASFSELQEGAESLALEVTKERERAAALATEQESATARMEAIPGELADIAAALAKLDETGVDSEAERATLVRDRAALEAEAEETRGDIEALAAQLRAANGRLEVLVGAQEQWRKAADSARATEAKRTEIAAQESAKGVGEVPALKALAAENLALAQRRAKVSLSVAEANQREAEVKAKAERFRRERFAAERRVRLLEEADLDIDPETGELLRAQRSTLPTSAEMRLQLREHVRRSAEAALDIISLQTERDGKRLGDISMRAGEIVEAAEAPKPQPADVEALLGEQRDLYEQLAADLEQRGAALANAAEIVQTKLKDVRAYSLFLDERLLWIRSTEPIGYGDFVAEGEALKQLAGGAFVEWLRVIGADVGRSPLVWAIWLLALGILIWRRRAFAEAIERAGELAKRRNCQSFQPTWLALLATLLHSLPLPLFFGFLAWRSYPSSPAFAIGFFAVASFSTLVGLARCASRPLGIVDAHFRFGEGRTGLLYRHLGWALPVGVPILFVGAALQELAPEPASRLSLIAALVMLLAVLHFILRPSAGMVLRKGKPTRLAYVWYLAGIGVPLALIVGASLGYLSSVQTLRLQTLGSLWMFVGVFFVAAVLLRWALVSRRKIAIQQALERREAAAAERAGGAGAELPTLEEVKANAVDVVGIEEQSARLVYLGALVTLVFGLYGIWANTLPALSVLDGVALWEVGETAGADAATTVPGTGLPAADGPDSPAPASEARGDQGGSLRALFEPTVGIVSLGDLLAGVVFLALTVAAARNIPGLLELAVLRRLHLPPGGSFAITTTARYLIVAVGLVVAFGKVGITWSNVQWIAAAVSVGVGFGLKEVFANFVSGIILLFERPFRVGDVITVGNDVSGKVTDVNMRSTTIRMFNSRELIVPNMEFITGQLVNWTLSDARLRIEIPVGIAYGSDTGRARQLLLKLAHDHPHVLDDPEPQVIFTAFGDSALMFELRCHVGQIDHHLATKNDLFFLVDDAFREAGIEIAFPQTDIHIRSMPQPNDENEKPQDR